MSNRVPFPAAGHRDVIPWRRVAVVSVVAACVAVGGCARPLEGTNELRVRRASLQREVAGLRESVARLERGESFLPKEDVLIAVEQSLIRDLIDAQLPYDTDFDQYHLHLDRVEVAFQESHVVRLRGVVHLLDSPRLSAEVRVVGGLDRFVMAADSAVLETRVTVDYVTIEKLAGLETAVRGAALEQLEETVRLRLVNVLPAFQIPVDVQRLVDVPAVRAGVIRFSPVSLPLQVTVSSVMPGQGRLWIAIHIEPGEPGPVRADDTTTRGRSNGSVP
jgi:hypothetical protein